MAINNAKCTWDAVSGVDGYNVYLNGLKTNKTSLSFDGVDDYVDLLGSSILLANKDEFTISLYAYRHSADDIGTIFSTFFNDGGNLEGMILQQRDTGEFQLFHYYNDFGDADVVTSEPFGLDEWHLVTVTKTTNNLKIYVDTFEHDSITSNGSVHEGVDIRLGQRNDPGTPRNYHGIIDEIQVWDKALTQQEIEINANKLLNGDEQGLIGYWNCEDRNKAYSFDGVGDYINLGTGLNTVFNGGGEITVEATVRADDFGASDYIGIVTEQYDPSENNVAFELFADETANAWGVGFFDGSWHEVSGGTLVTGEKVHLAGTYDGSTLKLFVNGIEVASLNDTAGLPAGDEQWTIGRRHDNFDASASHFNGIIDEVRIWSVGRTQQEIEDNINKNLQGTEVGLVSYYPFNSDSNDKAGSNDGVVNGASFIGVLTDITSNNNDGIISGATYSQDTALFKDIFEKENTSLIPTPEFTIEGLPDGRYEAYCTAVEAGIESEPSNVEVFEIPTFSMPSSQESTITTANNINETFCFGGNGNIFGGGSYPDLHEYDLAGNLINTYDLSGQFGYGSWCITWNGTEFLVVSSGEEWAKYDSNFNVLSTGSLANAVNLDGLAYVDGEYHVADLDRILVYDSNLNYLREITNSALSSNVSELYGIEFTNNELFLTIYTGSDSRLQRYDKSYNFVEEVNLSNIIGTDFPGTTIYNTTTGKWYTLHASVSNKIDILV